MAFHTFPLERADVLDDPGRYRFCSREELVALLAVDRDATVVDLGSGTGFYADDVAPFVDTLVGVDVQHGMHERYRERDVPDEVALATAIVGSLPLADGSVDAAYSTMTYHEYATPDVLEEVRRTLAPDGRHVVVDWSGDGDGDNGPSLDERFSLADAVSHHREAGFEIVAGSERPETFVLAAVPK